MITFLLHKVGKNHHEHGEERSAGDGQDLLGGVQHQAQQDREGGHGHQN